MSEETRRELSTRECGQLNERLADIWNNDPRIKMTGDELEERCGIDLDELRGMFRGNRIFSYEQYEAVAACMGFSMQELLEEKTAENTEPWPADNVPAMRSEILREAERIVYGDREDEYGSPSVNFQTIADMWTVYLGNKIAEPVQPYDVALMMVLLKISRVKNGGRTSMDHIVDIAGYAAIAGELLAGQEEKQ